MSLKGRLGLESAEIPHEERHGFVWLERGKLTVEKGTLNFTTAGSQHMEAGSYDIPVQTLSCIFLGPGGVVSQDALRILNRHDTGLLAVGQNGVRLYARCFPSGPDRSRIARRQARLWADESERMDVVRQMFAIRLGDIFPNKELDALRGIEGRRMKKLYRELADQYGIEWNGRRYDRSNPQAADTINRAINHASTATYAAAGIAVGLVGALPQLGFIHESSGRAFSLDIADLYRDDVTLPIAFKAAKRYKKQPQRGIESVTRKLAGRTFYRENVIPQMIDRIKELLHVDDHGGHS